MTKTAAALVLAIAMIVPASGQEKKTPSPLDGKTFSGKIMEEGKIKGDKDNLVFKDGKFTSTACVKYGFKASPYNARMEGDKTLFDATVKNKKGEVMAWQGTLENGKMAAKAVYTDKKGKQTNYNFEQPAK